MLIWSNKDNAFIIDPHYLTISVLRKVHEAAPDKKIGDCKLLWLYHMYNPHSPYRDYKDSTKSQEIIKGVFPPDYIKQQNDKIQAEINAVIARNKEIEEIPDEKIEAEEKARGMKLKKEEVPEFVSYDPENEEEMQEAIEWYRDHHLKQTSLWFAVFSYKEAMYNLSCIVKNPKSSANEIKVASTELDTIPLKMERMRKQAIKDEAQVLKVAGDKNIRRSERLPEEKTHQKITPGG